MKKRKFWYFILIVASTLFVNCNKGTTSTDGESIPTDSVLTNNPLEAQEVDQMVSIVNAVAACLDSIQVQEQVIFNMPEETPKEQVVVRLNSFKELLARKQSQINQLTSQNKSNKVTLANLQKMIDFLQQQLVEKTNQIVKLEDAVQNKDAKISELRYDLNALTAESDYLKDQNYEQDKLLNQAFYIVAEKKELKELGLLEGGALSKKRANYANIDQSKFKKVDVRGFEKLVINSKNPKLITEKPKESYTLTENGDGTSTLQITNANAFWSASPYLIIQL